MNQPCGNCRDAHTLLVPLARAAGFVDVGLHTGLEHLQSDGNDLSGSHAILHMRDPKSGLYYVQNYGQILNTNEKILTRAVDVSTSVMGELTGASQVESKPGVVHLYQPLTARWVHQTLDTSASFAGDKPLVSLMLGNREQTIRAQVGNESVKSFYVHSSFESSNGPYTLDAVGVAAQVGKTWQIKKKYLDEIGLYAQGYVGGLRLSVPVFGPDSTANETNWRMNAFAGTKLAGTARISTITGKLELNADSVDFGVAKPGSGVTNVMLLPHHELNAGVTWAPKGPMTLEARRTLEVTQESIADQNPVLRTAYDRINLVIDTRNGQNKPYIVSKTGVYFLGGTENMDAVGIHEHLRAGVPVEKLGEFYMVVDGSAIVANRAKDPFYEAPLAVSFGAGWTTRITKAVEMGIQMNVRNADKPFFLFEEPGSVVPEMGQGPAVDVSSNVWLGGKF